MEGKSRDRIHYGSADVNMTLLSDTRCQDCFMYVVLPSGELRDYYACSSKFVRTLIDGSCVFSSLKVILTRITN